MSSSPADGAAPDLEALAGELTRACEAVATGDLATVAAVVAAVDRLLADGSATVHATGGAAALSRVRERHGQLLAAAVGERDRTGLVLAKVRSSHRALRSYGWRRPASDPGQSV